MSNFYRGPSIDAFYQVSVQLVKQFQRRRLDRKSTIQKQELPVLPCLLTEQDKKSILYREPSIDASYQVSVHLAKQFSEEKIFFRNKPIRNKNCLWWSCLFY
jgi:hypothetical protein